MQDDDAGEVDQRQQVGDERVAGRAADDDVDVEETINAPRPPSEDLIVVALTSRVARLLPGEFVLKDWKEAKLNVPSAIKRGIYTVNSSLIIRAVGKLGASDRKALDATLRQWLGLLDGGK